MESSNDIVQLELYSIHCGVLMIVFIVIGQSESAALVREGKVMVVIEIPAVFWSHLFCLYLLFIELFIQTWPAMAIEHFSN